MLTRRVSTKIVGAFFTVCGLLSAQVPNPTQHTDAINTGGAMPVYSVTVVERATKTVNYHNRSGATKIDFRGTPLLPKAHGEAKVESKKGYIEIEVDFRELQAANMYGSEYLTYVLWAITPEGRTSNLGEILLNGKNAKVDVTTELQSFGLIVTAEPYYAVTQPSDVVVMENEIRKDTVGAVEQVDAKYELLKRGQYVLNVSPAQLKPVRLDKNTPLELYEARNAVQIARWAGAEKYAGETFTKATGDLSQAEGYLKRKAGTKPIITVSREAVQMSEDARIITIKKMREETLASERQAGADRELAAEAGQRNATEAKLLAEGERNSARLETDAARRQKAEAEAATAAARLATDNADQQRLKAQSEKADAEAATAAALLAKNEAQAETDKAHLATESADQQRRKAEAEKAELRGQLLRQFSLVLETRDTARGLIVNMSDVLFDTAKHTLRPGAREKLAKVAGIISGHPGLKLEVEGHTDNVGGDDYNQKLSEDRGSAVRDYLTQAGIASNMVTTKGMGKSMPVASNDTAAGRQQNRRVEMVVSGEIIGEQIGSPLALK
jgi:outer membrane protein OmpA-like peptidoglycan-associated protein